MFQLASVSKAGRGALLIALLVVGCSTAANVLLDLPERPQQGAATAGSPQASGPGNPALPDVGSRRRPPIESVSDRDSVVKLLPLDVAGSVDWMAALYQGTIDPAWSPAGDSGRPGLTGFGFDFRLRGPAEMFDAVFPHSSHVEWVACQSCHGAIFQYTDEPITMEAVNAGEACGRCHGPVAYPPTTCVRCHPAMPAFEPVADTLRPDLLLARAPATPGRVVAEPRAQFSHWKHRIRYRCTTCHPAIFEMRLGADTLTMDEMRGGGTCGTCHDGRVAFDLVDCSRCHVPAGDAAREAP